MSTVRVAVVQDEPSEALEIGLTRTHALAAAAAADGARLVVFPETWLPGYPVWLDLCRDANLWNHDPVKQVFVNMAEQAVNLSGASGRALTQIAADLGIVLVTGITERIDEGPGRGTLYNSLVTIGSDGRLLNHHRKLVPTYTERLVWGPGDTAGLRSVATEVGRVGGLICWEHWMPLARQELHNCGEDIHVAVWPNVHEMHQVASRHYAFEGRCFVMASGALLRAASLPHGWEIHPSKVGGEEGWVLRGGSAIIAPDGSYLTGPVYDQTMIISADLDLRMIRAESMTLDVTGHYSRPDCFNFETKKSARHAANR